MTKAKEIDATEFKAKCLKLIDSVQKTKTPILITKNGKPLAKLVPIEGEVPTFFEDVLQEREDLFLSAIAESRDITNAKKSKYKHARQ